MQSTDKNSYSYSVFQVSPTQSIQTQSTLSWHSGRGGASKHPNNYSGSHTISYWLSLQANRSALHVFKTIFTQNAYDIFSSSLLSANGLLFYFVWLITQGLLFTLLSDGIVVFCPFCNRMLNMLYLPWVSTVQVVKQMIGPIYRSNLDILLAVLDASNFFFKEILRPTMHNWKCSMSQSQMQCHRWHSCMFSQLQQDSPAQQTMSSSPISLFIPNQ